MLEDTSALGVPLPETNSSVNSQPGKKVLLIPNFIANSKETIEFVEDEIMNTNLGKLVYRSGQQNKPEAINMPQWTAANACICFKLIETGDLSNIDDIRNHMEHARNICELAQVNTIS